MKNRTGDPREKKNETLYDQAFPYVAVQIRSGYIPDYYTMLWNNNPGFENLLSDEMHFMNGRQALI